MYNKHNTPEKLRKITTIALLSILGSSALMGCGQDKGEAQVSTSTTSSVPSVKNTTIISDGNCKVGPNYALYLSKELQTVESIIQKQITQLENKQGTPLDSCYDEVLEGIQKDPRNGFGINPDEKVRGLFVPTHVEQNK